MKNQYFGDINDYVKYGLLRRILDAELRVVVAWMLTSPDGRPDGRFTDYLLAPDRYRPADPPLFDALQAAVAKGARSITVVEASGLLDGTTFFGAYLTHPVNERLEYFTALRQVARGMDVIFFDPDNGLEVPSVRVGQRLSPKYLYWAELEEAVARDHSVIVYQHFPRVPRESFVAALLERFELRLSVEASAVYTSRVGFFVLAQPAHRDQLAGAVQRAVETSGLLTYAKPSYFAATSRGSSPT